MSLQAEHWENIYKTKDHTKVGWYQATPGISLELFSKIQANPSQSIIDVGCGTSMLADNLIEQGYREITLVDFSKEALSTIKNRLGDKGNIPHYYSQDITKITFTRPFDIWHDRAVFHFLTDEKDRKNYMSTLVRCLSSNGQAIIGTFSFNGADTCSGLDIVQYDANKMNSALNPGLELVYSVTSMHIMPGGEEQEYMYFVIRHKNA